VAGGQLVARVIGQTGTPDGPHGGVLRVSSYEQENPRSSWINQSA
jgi:hypothetical protein